MFILQNQIIKFNLIIFRNLKASILVINHNEFYLFRRKYFNPAIITSIFSIKFAYGFNSTRKI